DPGDLLVQHVDGDIMLPTDHGPVRCYGLERPAASVRAKETGTVSYRATSWQVEPVPMSAQAAAAIGPEPIEAISTIEPVGVGPSTSAGTTNTQLNINLRPLGDDRFHIDITYDNQGGGARSGTFEGTKDEIRAWLRSLADLPSDALARILNTLDHIGQRRLFPPRGRWTLSTPGNTNIVSP
ncbi:MAG TPA: hypothetical protein VG713_22260, partial [Pirellulales bacterium]|nr:hypothetical protein [Pirellulales bacterium]